MHTRAQRLVVHFGRNGLDRVLGEMPGKERLVEYLQRRAGRELDKMTLDQLRQFLHLLRALSTAVETGEGFEEMVTAGQEREEPAA